MSHQLKAYKHGCGKCFQMLYHTRRDYYHMEFTSHLGDSRHLYKLLSNLTGGMIINNVPQCTSSKDLADEFS